MTFDIFNPKLPYMPLFYWIGSVGSYSLPPQALMEFIGLFMNHMSTFSSSICIYKESRSLWNHVLDIISKYSRYETCECASPD